jgi:hypothetical protein
MKKFVLSLGLILFLVCCGWQGDVGLGTSPAAAEHPRAPGYYQCDPYYNQCTYNNYYSAPYADPLTQFFYYSVPYWSGQHIRPEHPRRFDHPRREHRRYDHPR